MESPPERACPSCSAPTQVRQRWCLECGAELGAPRRGGVNSAIGIATALVLLVGATSAGGYTLLQDGKQPPPPPTTVAQAPPPAPAALPPATQEPSTYVPPPMPADTSSGIGAATTRGTTTSGTSSTRTSGSDTRGIGGAGVVEDDGDDTDDEQEPQLTPIDIALGALAAAYAPDAGDDVDFGDPSRVVDGTRRTAWRTPVFADPAAHPQIGVYLDLAGRETLRRLVIRTPTPGMAVEIYGARKGPPATIVDEGWDHLATRADVRKKTFVKLPDRPFRFILVWITGLPPQGDRAAISELSLISLQPE
jgi:hypothetical protein